MIKKHPLITFFILAYLITWSLQLTAIYLATPLDMPINNEANYTYFLQFLSADLPKNQLIPYLLFSLGAGPLFSAIIVSWITDGRSGIYELWRQSTKWKVSFRWYLIVFGLPILLSVVSVAIGTLIVGGEINYDFKLPLSDFFPFFIYMVIFTGITEEPGWRAFALPRLQKIYNAEQSSWILGILWGVWHFPFIIYYNYYAGLGLLIGSLIGLTLGIVGWTIVNHWIYNQTGSAWLIILLHGWNNCVQSYFVLSSDNMIAQTLYGILPWLLALFLLRKYGKETLASN